MELSINLVVNEGEKEMKWNVIFVLMVIFFTMSPFLIAWGYERNLNMEVNSPYLNGLITGCGVFVAFISASVISKAKDLDFIDRLLMKATLFFFIGSVVYLGYTLIAEERVTLLNLALFSSTLILGAFTAWGIMHTMFRQSRA